jgi:serine/threonine protein kinase
VFRVGMPACASFPCAVACDVSLLQLLDAAKGMLHLHKKGIIHRDLKSPNLLVDSTWKVKVRAYPPSQGANSTMSA